MRPTGVVPALRVTIGEDDVLLREGIARIVSGAGIDVVAQAGDADDLLRRTLAHRPDVAIVDVQPRWSVGCSGVPRQMTRCTC